MRSYSYDAQWMPDGSRIVALRLHVDASEEDLMMVQRVLDVLDFARDAGSTVPPPKGMQPRPTIDDNLFYGEDDQITPEGRVAHVPAGGASAQ